MSYKISEKLVEDIDENIFDQCFFDKHHTSKKEFDQLVKDVGGTAIQFSRNDQPLLIGAYKLHKIDSGLECEIFGVFSIRNDEKLIDDFIVSCEWLGRHLKADQLRFSTLRPGLIAKAKQHNFRVSEVLMRKFI